MRQEQHSNGLVMSPCYNWVMANTKSPAQTKAAKASKELAGVDLDSLRASMCKFPLGGIDDVPERFSGEPAVEGSPYVLTAPRRPTIDQSGADSIYFFIV